MNKFYVYAFPYNSTKPLIWRGLSKAKAITFYKSLSTDSNDYHEWGWSSERDTFLPTLKEATK